MKQQATTSPARPPPWARLSVPTGNGIQIAGMTLGAALLYTAGESTNLGAGRIPLMIAGFLAVYCCCHAIAHWAVGRLVGIRFRGYGVRSTDHPQDYPAGVRQLMSILPTFTAMTDKDSMRAASPIARALMFCAGETSTAVCSILAAYYALRAGIPGGHGLFYAMIAFNALSTVVTAIVPRGDYAKARRALQRTTQPAPAQAH